MCRHATDIIDTIYLKNQLNPNTSMNVSNTKALLNLREIKRTHICSKESKQDARVCKKCKVLGHVRYKIKRARRA